MTGSQVDKCTGGDEICLTHEAAVFVRDPSIYNITVWLNGPQETLSDIDKVTYHLHPTFQPQVVTRYSAEDRFSLSLTAWGQFTLGAEVLFKNGDKMFLPRFISFT
jgi:transcription initiation factor IIF auxiliary subunit